MEHYGAVSELISDFCEFQIAFKNDELVILLFWQVVKKAFEESYKKWKDNDKVHLQVAGQSWQVNCDMKGKGCRLSSGWDRFARDNSLTAGDVCIFELVDAYNKIIQVVIFRVTKETNG